MEIVKAIIFLLALYFSIQAVASLACYAGGKEFDKEVTQKIIVTDWITCGLWAAFYYLNNVQL